MKYFSIVILFWASGCAAHETPAAGEAAPGAQALAVERSPSASFPASQPVEYFTESYEMMGSVTHVKVAARPEQEKEARAAIELARSAMQNYIDMVSTWDTRSDATKINNNAGIAPQRVDARLIRLLLHAKEISRESGGAFDITVAPLVQLWKVRSPNFVLPGEEAIARAMALVDYRQLEVDEKASTVFLRRAGMRIDLSAIAEGAVADAGAASLRRSGFPNGIIDPGGDLCILGRRPDGPWRVGIQAPREPYGKTMLTLAVSDCAVGTSGDYENAKVIKGKRYHHIIDPRTGRPAGELVSVSVVAPNDETADALATTLFVLGPKEGIALARCQPKVEALIIDSSFTHHQTPGFASLIIPSADAPSSAPSPGPSVPPPSTLP